MLPSSMTAEVASAPSTKTVDAAAAAVAAVGDTGGTRNDEAITGAAGAPVVTIMVEDSQLMPTLTQSGASASHRLHALNVSSMRWKHGVSPQRMSAAVLTALRTVMH